MTSLFLFAHQDDEFGIITRMQFERDHGRKARILYLTDGRGRGVSSEVRQRESLRAFAKADLSPVNIDFLGSSLGVPDGRLMEHLETVFYQVSKASKEEQITRIFVPAWEGGHQDHDATHLLGLALARDLGLENEIWEFSLYNAVGAPPKFFRVLRAIPNGRPFEARRLTLREGLKAVGLLLCYRSQWRTFLGLGPEAFFRLVVLRREYVQKADFKRVTARPHQGLLLYERLFKVDFVKFKEMTAAFQKRYLPMA